MPRNIAKISYKIVLGISVAVISFTIFVLAVSSQGGQTSRGDNVFCINGVIIGPILLAALAVFLSLRSSYRATKNDWEKIQRRRPLIINIFGIALLVSTMMCIIGLSDALLGIFRVSFLFTFFGPALIIIIIWLLVYLGLYKISKMKHERPNNPKGP